MTKKIKDETAKISMRISKNKLELLMAEYGTNSITEVFEKLVDDKLNHRFQADARRSVITGIGGKNRVAKRIIELIPDHRIYIEPFGNTASVLLQKPKANQEVYNDIESNVTNFFMVLRDNPIGLYNACVSLPYSEHMYYEFLKSKVPDDPLDKAVRFFYLNRCGFLGSNSKGFKTNSPTRNYAKFYYKECERFLAVSKRFQNVEITNKNFKKVITKYQDDPEAFFLCDPPYYDGTNYYSTDFKLADHSVLAHQLANIKGKAMVCHSKNYQIHKLYTGLGFRSEVIRTKYISRAQYDEAGNLKRPDALLYLYMNY
jgi:DNA adenine methylase